jgi:type VI protein secretion system component Hcp
MAFDMFMVLPPTTPSGLKLAEEPTLDQYFKSTFVNQPVVEIRSFSLEVENPTTIGSATGGAGTGKATLKPFVIEKSVDLLSESLYQMNTTGTQAAKMQVFLRKAGTATTGGKPYLVYGFGMVFVNKIEWSASEGDDQPIERVEFAYGSLSLAYYPQKPDGTFAATTPARITWNQMTNTDQLPQGADVFTNV